MDLVSAIILGIVEGITEFLPISSTGHLILASNLLKIPQTEFVKTFEIAIQSGAILSVIVLYWRTLISRPRLAKQVLVAFIPTAIIGFTLHKFIKQYLIGSSEVVLLSLFLGGIFLIAVEILMRGTRGSYQLPVVNQSKKQINRKPEDRNSKVETRELISELSYERAFAIGLFQAAAMIPGVSRAAATIIGGLLVGLTRKSAVEFSFLLAVPTMLAATALDLKETNLSLLTSNLSPLLAGFITSFVVSLICVKWLLKYIQTNTFISFGIYRVILSILYFFLT